MRPEDRTTFFIPGWRPQDRRSQLAKAGVIALSLLWLILPIVDLATSGASTGRMLLGYLGCAAFVAIYLGSAMRPRSADCPPGWENRTALPNTPVSMVLALVAIAVALTVLDRTSWSLLLVFAASAAGIRLEPRVGLRFVIACTVLAALLLALLHADDGSAVSIPATTLAMGLLMLAFGRLIRLNIELAQAREELAEAAVDEERLRFARDLHDLLGHNLSVIALKAQLARRLLDADPEGARRELADVEEVTRTALKEVREAVTGYRAPRLETELEGARNALAAAGIACIVQRAGEPLPAGSEAVLAWAVREATTNVIRHSRARRCDIRIAVDDGRARLEVVDDGSAPRPPGASQGSGLRGLAERAARAGGALAAGPRDGGGFGLEVSVPLGRAA